MVAYQGYCAKSPGESHECRIQSYRQEQMANSNGRHRQDGHEVLDPPIVWHPRRCCEYGHGYNTQDGEADAELEASEDFWNLDEEVAELCLLRSCAPSHVDFEHVSKQSLRYVEGQATKEDGKHERPLEILEKRAEDGVGGRAVAHDGECNVAETIEDDDDGEPHLKEVSTISRRGTDEIKGLPFHESM
jgi:hypothetical protein